MKKTKLACAALAAMSLAMFTACDDEVTKVSERAEFSSIDKYKELEKCEGDVIGQMAYAKDSAKIYACTSDGWITLNGADGSKGEKGEDGAKGDKGEDGAKGVDGKDGTSCVTKENADKTGFDVICDGKTVGSLLNGSVGLQGEAGKSAFEIAQENDESVKKMTAEQWIASLKGEKGEGCSAIKVTNGIKITCGKDDFTITNGEDGANCEIVSDKNGVVELQCGEETTTLYKAMCGKTPYDPEKFECVNGVLCAEADLWCGNRYYSVQTGSEKEGAGKWFSFNDINEEGTSVLTWPNGKDESELNQVIDYCHGLCGTFSLGEKTENAYIRPYVGVAFYVFDERNKRVPGDVSDWGGVCIYYTSDIDIYLTINFDDDVNNSINWNFPAVTVPATDNAQEQCYAWSEFVQPEGAMKTITTEDAVANVTSLWFNFFGKDVENAKFNIIRLRKYADGIDESAH